MDWNGDGLQDILVGDREGSVNYFRRLPFGEVFLVGEPAVQVAGRPIRLPHNSSPCVTDWNGDALPDLIVGRSEGIPAGLFLFVNEGAPGSPLYPRTDTVLAAGAPIQFYYTYPDIHDMDGDGLGDLVFGSTQGRIACCLNSGTPSEPVLEDTVFLQSEGEEIHFYSYVRPTVCDWNADGCPDVLAADYTGCVFLFIGQPGTGIGESRAPAAEGPDLEILGNPSTGTVSFRLTLSGPEEAQATLRSVDGRVVLRRELGVLSSGAHELGLDGSGLPPGLLLLEIRGRSGFVAVADLVLR